MKFIVDRMLGSLSTWMRVLGFDAAYFPEAYSRKIIQRSLSEQRIIITRNQRVSAKRSFGLIRITSNYVEEQITQVLRDAKLTAKKNKLFSRCTYCNNPVSLVSKRAVYGKVPAYVYKTCASFSTCVECHRIYWKGTHNTLLIEHLEKIGIRLA